MYKRILIVFPGIIAAPGHNKVIFVAAGDMNHRHDIAEQPVPWFPADAFHAGAA